MYLQISLGEDLTTTRAFNSRPSPPQILLNELGFDDGFITPLRERYLRPLTSVLYPDCGGRCLDSHKAFVVKYDMNEDLDLSYHYDNAEVTLNVSIGKDFTEGNLYFGDMKQVNFLEIYHLAPLLFLVSVQNSTSCPPPSGSSERGRVYGGGAQGDRGPPAPGPAHARGPAHLLRPALEPHRVDESLAGAQPAVPHVQPETHAGGGRGLRRRLHQKRRHAAAAAADDEHFLRADVTLVTANTFVPVDKCCSLIVLLLVFRTLYSNLE